MILMTTIDDSGGLLFNHRRQSQDRILRQHMLDIAGPGWYLDGRLYGHPVYRPGGPDPRF